LEPTALVHDAWIRLMGKQGTAWEHRAHFFGAAAQAMRRILVERARKAKRARHGGGRRRVSLDEAPAPLDEQCSEVLALEDLLAELETLDRRKHDVVMLRHYAGLTIEETARALEVSVATVKADWTFARSWLKARLKESAGP
jgi:RNA polymerase sigma factor (TIGR02999 family)